MKRLLKGMVLLLLLAMSGACGRVNESAEKGKEPAVQIGQETAEERTPSEPEEELHVEADEKTALEENRTDLFYYGFEALKTQEERRLYEEMLSSLLEREKETELSTLSAELIDSVFQCVMADHPEIFYVDGYTSTTYKLGGSPQKITFSGDYTLEEEEIRRRSRLLDEAAADWMEGIAEGADDYGTVKYLYEYLIGHTEYEKEAKDSQNICSVLLNGRSVCQGYAKTLQWLCQKAGIPALLVTGHANGGGHAWIAAELDGEWYHVDPTWGDASYLGGEGNYPDTAYPSINYDYFCVTTKQIGLTHEISQAQKIPVCTAVEDQYYRREGLFLEAADPAQIERIFENARQSGRTVVSFQCADDTVYEQVYRMLIEEQGVFDYLPDAEGKTAYADSRESRTFSFWLS